MAVTVRVYQNTSELARVTIPDPAIPEIQAALGGATNAETAALFLDLLLVFGRKRVLALLKNAQEEIDQGTLRDNQTTRDATFNTNWPGS